MPILDDKNMKAHRLALSTYGFSAKRVGDLGATEYTLVAIAADVSTSVTEFRDEIEACVKAVVSCCRQSPRADNLLVRLVAFDSRLHEIHGFRPLADCHPDAYDGALQIGGATALYDAAANAVESVGAYGRRLTESGLAANAIVVVITDGWDNTSTLTAKSVADALRGSLNQEALESFLPILVGVNVAEAELSQYLQVLKRDAGFIQYVELEQADAPTLARLADFVSRSIAAQSLCLGTGGPSQSLTF